MAQRSRELRKRESSGNYWSPYQSEEEKPQKKLDEFVKENEEEDK